MLAVMVELICTLHTSLSEWEESDLMVRMQLFSYISSLCAQNKSNCRLACQHILVLLALDCDCCRINDCYMHVLYSRNTVLREKSFATFKVWLPTCNSFLHKFQGIPLPQMIECKKFV